MKVGQLTHAESPTGLFITESVRIGYKLCEFIVSLAKVGNFDQLAGVLGIFINSLIIPQKHLMSCSLNNKQPVMMGCQL